mgnify:CR=1 FL=1
MSKLMFIFGILFVAAGIALGLLIHFSPGEMQVRGLTPVSYTHLTLPTIYTV